MFRVTKRAGVNQIMILVRLGILVYVARTSGKFNDKKRRDKINSVTFRKRSVRSISLSKSLKDTHVVTSGFIDVLITLF